MVVNLRFEPDVSEVEHIEFRPYMIECAYDYFMMAKASNHQRMSLQCIMSALAIEVLFKSFNAKVTSNHGQLDETYEFNRQALPKKSDPHDLDILSNSLSESVSCYLLDKYDFKTIEKNKDIFKQSRYIYEVNANSKHTNCIIKLAGNLLCKIIYLYKAQGCKDPFIIDFDINELYFNQVQQYAFVDVL